MTLYKRLLVNVSINFVAELINKLVPLIALGYAARILALESFGQAQYAMYLIDICSFVTIMGVQNWASVAVREFIDRPEALAQHLLHVLLYKVLSGFLAFGGGLFFLLSKNNGSLYLPLFLPLSLMILTSALDFSFLLIAQQKVKYLLMTTMITRVLSVIGLLALMKNQNDSLLFAMLTLLPSGITSVYSFICGWSFFKGTKKTISLSHLHHVFKHSLPFILWASLTFSLDRFDILLVERFSSPQTLGLYTAPSKIFFSVLGLLQSTSMLFFSELLGVKDQASIAKIINLNLFSLSALAFPIAVGSWFFSSEIMGIIFGENFPSVHWLFPVMTTALIPHVFMLIYGNNFLLWQNKLSKLNLFYFSSLVFGVLAIAFIYPYYHNLGAGIALLLAKVLLAIMILVTSLKILKEFPWTKIVSIIIACSLMVGSIIILSSVAFSWWVNIVCSGIVYSVTLLIMERRTFASIINKSREF